MKKNLYRTGLAAIAASLVFNASPAGAQFLDKLTGGLTGGESSSDTSAGEKLDAEALLAEALKQVDLGKEISRRADEAEQLVIDAFNKVYPLQGSALLQAEAVGVSLLSIQNIPDTESIGDFEKERKIRKTVIRKVRVSTKPLDTKAVESSINTVSQQGMQTATINTSLVTLIENASKKAGKYTPEELEKNFDLLPADMNKRKENPEETDIKDIRDQIEIAVPKNNNGNKEEDVGKTDAEVLKESLERTDAEIAENIKRIMEVYAVNIGDLIESIKVSEYLLTKIADRTKAAEEDINDSIGKYNEQAALVAADSVKQVAILALQVQSMKKLLEQLASDPIQGLRMLPKVKDMVTDIQSLIQTLSRFAERRKAFGEQAQKVVEVTGVVRSDIGALNKTIAGLAPKVMETWNLNKEMFKKKAAEEEIDIAAILEEHEKIIKEANNPPKNKASYNNLLPLKNKK